MIQKTHKLGFGKHKGKTIEEILECDPTYIRWAIKTISGFELSEEDTKFALELAYKADCSTYDTEQLIFMIIVTKKMTTVRLWELVRFVPSRNRVKTHIN